MLRCHALVVRAVGVRMLLLAAVVVGMLGLSPARSVADGLDPFPAATPQVPTAYFSWSYWVNDSAQVADPIAITVFSTDEAYDPEVGPTPGGAPVSERPALVFEVELWSQSQLVWSDEVDATRPMEDYPTFSQGTAEAVSGLPRGAPVQLRARATWPDAPSGVVPTSDWSPWRDAVAMGSVAVPTHTAPVEGAVVTAPERPTFAVQVEDGADLRVHFQVLNEDDWEVGYGVATADASGVATWQLPEVLPTGTYRWHALASNGMVQSDWSAYSTVELRRPPAAPIGAYAQGGSRSAWVYWQRDWNDQVEVTGYTVTVLPDGPSVTVDQYATSTYLSGLAISEATAFSVQTLGLQDASEPVLTEPVRIVGFPPSPPQNLESVVDGAQATLTWDEPTDDGGSPVADYVVRYRAGRWGLWQEVVVTGTTATLTDLQFGESYTAYVSAPDSRGDPGRLCDHLVQPVYDSGCAENVQVRPDDSALDLYWEYPRRQRRRDRQLGLLTVWLTPDLWGRTAPLGGCQHAHTTSQGVP